MSITRVALATPLAAALLLGAGAAQAAADGPDDQSQLIGLQQRGEGGSQQLGVLSSSHQDGRSQSQLLGAQQSSAAGDQQQAGVASTQRDDRGRAQSQLVGAQQTERTGDQQQLGLGQQQTTPSGDQQQTGALQRQREGRAYDELDLRVGPLRAGVAR